MRAHVLRFDFLHLRVLSDHTFSDEEKGSKDGPLTMQAPNEKLHLPPVLYFSQNIVTFLLSLILHPQLLYTDTDSFNYRHYFYLDLL